MSQAAQWLLLVLMLSVVATGVTAEEATTFDGRLPDGWSTAKDGRLPGFEGETAVFTADGAGLIQRELDARTVREVRVRFRLGVEPLMGFGVGLVHGQTTYRTVIRDDGMFAWRGPKPHYAGPRWSADSTYEVRYVFGEGGVHTELVLPDGIATTAGHLQRYGADLGPRWREQPLWLTVGGADADADGRVEVLEALVLNEADEAPVARSSGSTIERSLAKYRRLRQGEPTEAIGEAVEGLKSSRTADTPSPPRFDVQAWDAQKLRSLLSTDDGARELARGYTLLQMRSPPERDVVGRLLAHDMDFALYINTRQPRYVEALPESQHVMTHVSMKNEQRERVNVFSGDWIELSTVGTLHQIRAALANSPLRRVLLDSEYATGVGDDPLSAAALAEDHPGASLAGLSLPPDRFTKVFRDDDPAWQAAAWRSRWGMSNVGHRAIAEAVDRLWPAVEVTTDPIDDHGDLEQFRGLDLVQHWVRVHWAPRHPRSVAYYTERGRVHVRNQESVRGVVIGPQLGRDNRRTPPDMLSEACWMAVAFGARGITHWGNQAIFNDDGSFAPGGEAAWETLVRLRSEVYGPLEELLLQWEPVPRRMAMLVSQADAISSAGRRFTHDEACENTYRAILSIGEPCDVVYDREVLDGRLDEYEVLIVPSLYVANEGLVRKIRGFAEGGGTVIAHEGSVLEGLPRLRVIGQDLAPRYRDYWIRRGEPTLLPHEYEAFLHDLAATLRRAMPLESAVSVDTPSVVANLMHDGETRYLTLVNDTRTYGEEAEALGQRYMLDRGERVTVRVKVETAGGYFDAITDQPLPMDAGHAVVEIEPGWGRVIRLEP